MSRALILDLVRDLIAQGAERFTPDQIDRVLAITLTRYNTDSPRSLVEDVTADGSKVLPLPSGWEEAFSQVSNIESPVDQFPPADLAVDRWLLRVTPAGQVLSLAEPLRDGQAARVTYTAGHILTDAHCTVPAAHFEAVAYYTAGSLCEQLAAACADNSDPTITADRVDQRSPAQEWAARARIYRTRYFSALGIRSSSGQESARPAPASAVTNLNMTPSFQGGWNRRKH